MKDPFLNHILGLTAAGILSSAWSISGYLPATEQFQLGVIRLEYPATQRKIPLAVLGFGLCYSAWWLTQERKEWKREYLQWKRQNERISRDRAAIAHQAQLESHQQVARLQAAEQAYPYLAPYMDAQTVDWQPAEPQPSASPVQSPGMTGAIVSPASAPPPVDQPVPQTGTSAFQGRDLTAEIARYDGHILIASRTRSGKTTTIQSAIRHTHSRYNGKAQFNIFDPKGAAWCGLERTPSRYLFCNKPEIIPEVLSRLESLIGTMQGRQATRMQQGGHYTAGTEPDPIIVAIDEFNTLQSLAKEHDDSFPPKNNPRTQVKLQRYVERFIFQGAEDKVYLWLMAQTTRVAQLGLDTSVQDNMAYFAQSRNGDYQSVEDAISNNYVVANQTQRKDLQALLTAYRFDGSQDLKIPIAFTTLGGNQLCKLPDLSQAKFYQIPGTEAQAITPPPPPSPQAGQDDPRYRLEFLLNNSPNFSQPNPTNAQLSEGAKSLFSYLQKRDWTAARIIKKNWGGNNGFSSSQVEQFLTELLSAGWVETATRQSSDQALWRAKTEDGND